ncbi:MAG: BON domain-containing protein [Vicinamibacterales bacterium]
MRALPLSLMLAAAALAGACNGPDERSVMTDTAADSTATADMQAETDDWITTQVEARFYGDADVPNDIDVSTDQGIVTLSGDVASTDASAAAAEAARGVSGVVDVRNDLAVAGAAAAEGGDAASGSRTAENRPVEGGMPGDTDEEGPVESAWITTKIQAQYFMDDEVKGRNIDVTTRDGVVTLAGFVDSEMERQQALRIARNTEDVSDVRDRLRIRPEDTAQGLTGPITEADDNPDTTGRNYTSDDSLTTRVQSKFYLDDDVRGDQIDVSTDGGVVTLSGKVATEASRRRAVSLANNVAGVRDVKDELEVEVGAPRTMRPVPEVEDTDAGDDAGRDLGERLGDGWITTKVQAQYYLDTDLKGRDIDVSTKDGVVTLTGQVETEPQRRLAIQTARDTDGVVSVVDNLLIVPDEGQ